MKEVSNEQCNFLKTNFFRFKQWFISIKWNEFLLIMFILSLLPYFVFRSDQEFYLTSILWGKNHIGSQDFLLSEFSMQNFSWMVIFFSSMPFSTEIIQIFQWILYLTSVGTIIFCLIEIYSYFFGNPKWIWLFLPWLLIINPQASFSANRFITDNLHPRNAALSFILLSVYILLNKKKNSIWLWGIGLFIHPLTALLMTPWILILSFKVFKDKMASIQLLIRFILLIMIYIGLQKIMDIYHISAGPFQILDSEWEAGLRKSMSFIFPDYFISHFETAGIETIVSILAFYFLALLSREYSIILLGTGILLSIFIVMTLASASHRVIFYQLQPLRLFNFLHVLVIFSFSIIFVKPSRLLVRNISILIFCSWILLKTTEDMHYQYFKYFGAFICSVVVYLVIWRKVSKYVILILVFLSWGYTLSLSWNDGHRYEIFGKAFTVEKYSEWPELVRINEWAKSNSRQDELFVWDIDDYRASLFRLISNRPVFVTGKDGGVVLYSARKSIEWTDRLEIVKKADFNEFKSLGVSYFITTRELDWEVVYTDPSFKLKIYQIK